eukprot:CAMPEP_0178825914 /NCGR_PEP_ID=MMETSP0746-20121128/6476_1 /TAXON_ID=913974 /ORGANISM="Nitzschia punctata, Strain CCMP561" /LENGTH=191 /DNA_ID=CAMNT_0020487711 /DNA_START=86 /DNA_END=661 /DNA_ORIENTATION=+
MAPFSQEQPDVAVDDVTQTWNFAFCSQQDGMNLDADLQQQDQTDNDDDESNTKTKSVRFADVSERNVIPNIDDFSPQEIQDSFMSRDDYLRIQMENSYTLSAMDRGIFPDNDYETFRGLENGMRDYYVERKHMVQVAVSSVLREQAKLFLLDPIWIEQVYRKMTARSSVFAMRAGSFDARAAGVAPFAVAF